MTPEASDAQEASEAPEASVSPGNRTRAGYQRSRG